MTREEAIKIVKEFINGTCLHLVDQEALKTLIPELCESEDERIRKCLLDIFKQSQNGYWAGMEIKDIVAWLEKQKEQKTEAKLTGWVARDSEHNPYFGLGLFLFKEKPRRSGDCWCGTIASRLPWDLFPDLKWEDGPVEVEITIKRK